MWPAASAHLSRAAWHGLAGGVPAGLEDLHAA